MLAVFDGHAITALGDAVPVVDAQRAGRVLRESVTVALTVSRAHEGADDLEAPLGDLARLPPEVGEAQVDVELEKVDSGRSTCHGVTIGGAPDDIGGWLIDEFRRCGDG